MPKKRFNAFDDFPVEPTPADWQPEASPAPASAPPANPPPASAHEEHRAPYRTAADEPPTGAAHILNRPEAPQVERIERLRPSQMLPDRFQPRRLLPGSLRPAFFSGQLTCYQTAEKWLQLAKTDSGIQAEVERLLAMGLSFEEHGQIKPITGCWVETGLRQDGYRFQIETGERRFWAACLQTVAHGFQEEPYLRVEVVGHPTRMRQVLENRHAEPPSAVGQACEVASLILAEIGVVPGGGEPDEFDFFRQARAQRMPAGLWERIMPIMQLTRVRMVQLLNILSLPTPLLDLADRYRIPERVLREVLSAPRDQWENLLRTSITNSLTSDDVAELLDKARPQPKSSPRSSSPPDPAQVAINALKRFVTSTQMLDEDTQSAVLDELANDLVTSDQAEAAQAMLRDLSERLRIRQQNRARRR